MAHRKEYMSISLISTTAVTFVVIGGFPQGNITALFPLKGENKPTYRSLSLRGLVLRFIDKSLTQIINVAL
jgi:hypothetical protein